MRFYENVILDQSTRRKISWQVYGCDRKLPTLEEVMTASDEAGTIEGHEGRKERLPTAILSDGRKVQHPASAAG